MAKGGKKEEVDLGFHNLADYYGTILTQYLRQYLELCAMMISNYL